MLALKGILSSSPNLSFILGETEAQMAEGLVQVNISIGVCNNPLFQPLPTWTPPPNMLLAYFSRDLLIFRAHGDAREIRHGAT
jgi:hypothetical protein